MQLGPGHPPPAVLVLGCAGAFGTVVWVVTLYLLTLRAMPSTTAELAVLLGPAALASMALAFGAGLWLGRQHLARPERGSPGTAPSDPAGVQRSREQHGLDPITERAGAEEHRIARLLEGAAPGAALFDATHHLLAWNHGFAALAELPEEALQPGLPLATLVRLQPASQTRKLSRHGIESGVAGAARRQRGDGSHVEDRWTPAPEGGVLLTCRLAEPARQAVPLSAAALAALCEDEVRTRLPRLQAAVEAGDGTAARMEAHAIRGVAAGFGLAELAEALLAVEVAARAGDLEALVAASSGLPQRAEDALRRLGRQPA